MNGWLPLAVLVGASLALSWWLGLRGRLLGLTACSLMIGAGGFALSRSTDGGPAVHAVKRAPPPTLAAERRAFFGNFPPAERWLILADSYARSGDTLGAAQTLLAATKSHPHDVELWVGLGTALVDHAGRLNPAARFAYYRAIELAPHSPAPRFFFGIALATSGDRAGAEAEWRAILATAPPTTSWRALVESRQTAPR